MSKKASLKQKPKKRPTPPAKRSITTLIADGIVAVRKWFGGLDNYGKFWAVVLGVLMVFVLFAGVRQGFIMYEKRDFENARLELDQLHREIVGALGEPIKSEKSQSCGYASAKFERGRLGCGVRFELYYPKSAYTPGFYQTIDKVVRSHNGISVSYSELGRHVDQGSTNRRYMELLFEKSTKQCVIEMVSPSPTEREVAALHMIASCSDDALAEHYPVTEK